MSFWDITRRLIQGKPAFEAPKPEDDWDDAPTTDFSEDRKAKRAEANEANDTDLHDANGRKQIPVVGVTQAKYDTSGPNMDVWATIHNHSKRAIELDKMVMMGARVELDYPLAPGAQREFRVYRGPRPAHDSYKKAELYYKDTLSGDYFRADHLIGYKYEADKTYSIQELELLTPINDV